MFICNLWHVWEFIINIQRWIWGHVWTVCVFHFDISKYLGTFYIIIRAVLYFPIIYLLTGPLNCHTFFSIFSHLINIKWYLNIGSFYIFMSTEYQWDWAYFQMFSGLLYFFFYDVSAQILCQFFYWVDFFSYWFLRVLYICWFPIH